MPPQRGRTYRHDRYSAFDPERRIQMSNKWEIVLVVLIITTGIIITSIIALKWHGDQATSDIDEKNKLKQFSLPFDEDNDSTNNIKIISKSVRELNGDDRRRTVDDDATHDDERATGHHKGRVSTKVSKVNTSRARGTKGTDNDTHTDDTEASHASSNFDSIENIFANRLNINSRRKKLHHQQQQQQQKSSDQETVELITTSESQGGAKNVATVKNIVSHHDDTDNTLPAFPAPIGFGDKTIQPEAEFTTDGAGFVLTDDTASSQEITAAASNVLADSPSGPVTGDSDNSQVNGYPATRIIYQEVPVPVEVPVEDDHIITPFTPDDAISTVNHNEHVTSQQMLPNVAYATPSHTPRSSLNGRDTGSNQHNNIQPASSIHFNVRPNDVSTNGNSASSSRHPLTPPQHNFIPADVTSTSMNTRNSLNQQQQQQVNAEQATSRLRNIKYQSNIQASSNGITHHPHHRHHKSHVNHATQRMKPVSVSSNYDKNYYDQVSQSFISPTSNHMTFTPNTGYQMSPVNLSPKMSDVYDEKNILTPILRAQAEASNKHNNNVNNNNNNGNKVFPLGVHRVRSSPEIELTSGQQKVTSVNSLTGTHKLPVFIKNSDDQMAASSSSPGYFIHNGQLIPDDELSSSLQYTHSDNGNSRRSSSVDGEYTDGLFTTKDSTKGTSNIPLGMPLAGILLHQQRQKAQRRQSEPIVSLNKREVQSNVDEMRGSESTDDELESVNTRRQDGDDDDSGDDDEGDDNDGTGDEYDGDSGEYDDGIVRRRRKRQVYDKESLNLFESPYLSGEHFHTPYGGGSGGPVDDYPISSTSDLYNFGGSRRRLTHSTGDAIRPSGTTGNNKRLRSRSHQRRNLNSNDKSYGMLGSGNFEVIRGGIFGQDGGHAKVQGHETSRRPNRNKYDESKKFTSSYESPLDDDELFNSHRNPILGFQGYDNFQLASNQEEDMKKFEEEEESALDDQSSASSNVKPQFRSQSTRRHSMVSFDGDLMAIA